MGTACVGSQCANTTSSTAGITRTAAENTCCNRSSHSATSAMPAPFDSPEMMRWVASTHPVPTAESIICCRPSTSSVPVVANNAAPVLQPKPPEGVGVPSGYITATPCELANDVSSENLSI